jgi:hypothetical protein
MAMTLSKFIKTSRTVLANMGGFGGELPDIMLAGPISGPASIEKRAQKKLSWIFCLCDVVSVNNTRQS